MAGDESTTTEETPDAVVELHVDGDDDADSDAGDTTVVVVTGDGEGDSDTDLDHEHRITALEHSLEELRSEMYQRTTSTEMVEIIAEEAAAEAVADAVVAADVVAEETAAEVAEETVEEVVDEIQPHKTHWLERSFSEWFGKNGSGKVERK